MRDRHADIENDVLTFFAANDAGIHLPRVKIGVAFEEVIETAIAGNFELWADAK